MKYMIPSLASFLIAMIFKYPSVVAEMSSDIQDIIGRLLSNTIRLEPIGLSIGSAMFEKVGILSDEFLKSFLFSCFSTLHFYRNNTKTKVIPVPISKSVFTTFANFIINHGTEALVRGCDGV